MEEGGFPTCKNYVDWEYCRIAIRRLFDPSTRIRSLNYTSKCLTDEPGLNPLTVIESTT